MRRPLTVLIMVAILLMGVSPLLGADGDQVNDLQQEELERLFQLRRSILQEQVKAGLIAEEEAEKMLEMLELHQELGIVHGLVPYYLPQGWFFWEEWPELEDKMTSLEFYYQALQLMSEVEEEIKELKIEK